MVPGNSAALDTPIMLHADPAPERVDERPGQRGASHGNVGVNVLRCPWREGEGRTIKSADEGIPVFLMLAVLQAPAVRGTPALRENRRAR